MRIRFLLFLTATLLINAQQRSNKVSDNGQINIETEKIYNKLVDIRRDLHEYPELAGHEMRTQKIIEKYLLDLGLTVETDVYGHSVIGVLKGGKEGRKIAWRSDMDALPSDGDDKVSFKSRNKGIWHGCGHDIHMAIGLGIAEVLAKNKKNLKGTVYFIFQPEEETFKGAKNMITEGLLSKINPDEIYGLHVTALPVGQIMVKPEEMYAYQKRIKIQFKNTVPEEQVRELSKKIHSSLTRIKTDSKPWDLQNILDPKTGLTNPDTIFKDYLIMDEKFVSYQKNERFFMEAYLYETNASRVERILPEIKNVIAHSAYKDQLISVTFSQENPTVLNDKKLTEMSLKTLQSIYGKDNILRSYGQIPYFNDDFSYFQQKIPGVYFLLGGSNIKKGIIAMNHTPGFEVDEESIKVGVRSFSSLIMERLKQK
ncbi:amidohydrolase [Elizabethkingia meningoseptica]|uniref:M20 metallopeptidase family protein n=1 Tax=Elizabethkingia meningoseptica TaxID=238 RepID=UPI000332CC7B|nr:amidohydrolase [Elizabethkingia meningoseptica]AQX05435.1 amidohydrolase [Elizabethkingia meningoseptica]AQX47478.1 amidohydrolase [Elizabethkingia meningoseptica]EOR29725.1 amidohydrolase [Elizabethkingia meningoseptica ATCC 13253 = NBRC 12535]KUY24256.1 amidohydrolase [Elizabethkingia meningoseptica]OPB67543.1 amidohydrolase [Elizabethkingia meningoseptica]